MGLFVSKVYYQKNLGHNKTQKMNRKKYKKYNNQ